MRVLLATDSFPPNCGGSGWSTYELARGLRARGHQIEIVHAASGTTAGRFNRTYDDFAVTGIGVSAPDIPYVRNYFKNERLYPKVSDLLLERIRLENFELVHGQHVMTALPAVAAAERASEWWCRGSAQPGEQVYSKACPFLLRAGWRGPSLFILC